MERGGGRRGAHHYTTVEKGKILRRRSGDEYLRKNVLLKNRGRLAGGPGCILQEWSRQSRGKRGRKNKPHDGRRRKMSNKERDKPDQASDALGRARDQQGQKHRAKKTQNNVSEEAISNPKEILCRTRPKKR